MMRAAAIYVSIFVAACAGPSPSPAKPMPSEQRAPVGNLTTMRAGLPVVPSGPPMSLFWPGDGWGCALRQDTDEIVCWGRASSDPSCGPLCARTIPELDASLGFALRGDRACAMADDETIHCYKRDELLNSAESPD